MDCPSRYREIFNFLSDIPGDARVVQRPSIWVIDLQTDSVVSRHEIPLSVISDGLGLANLAVDVVDCENDTFAYLPDLVSSQILVYNLNENRSYSVRHNYLHMHPFEGNYDVDGLKFQWDDAIFSIALGERDEDSYRRAYFHPMSRYDSICSRIVSREFLERLKSDEIDENSLKLIFLSFS